MDPHQQKISQTPPPFKRNAPPLACRSAFSQELDHLDPHSLYSQTQALLSAQLYLSVGDLQQAQVVYDTYLQNHPYAFDVRLALGYLYYRQGRHPQRIQEVFEPFFRRNRTSYYYQTARSLLRAAQQKRN